MITCRTCNGTGEITNAKGQADACQECARAAEKAWRDKITSGGKHGRDDF
jgi:hypothetical protein